MNNMTFSLLAEPSSPVVADLVGSYAEASRPDTNQHSAAWQADVLEWRVDVYETGDVLHSFDVRWPADRDITVRLRAPASATGGLTVVCSRDGCALPQ